MIRHRSLQAKELSEKLTKPQPDGLGLLRTPRVLPAPARKGGAWSSFLATPKATTWNRLQPVVLTAALLIAATFLIQASDPGIGDWPMWGGTPDRNMVSSQKVVSSWDVKTGKNVKWVAQLGSQTYGN